MDLRKWFGDEPRKFMYPEDLEAASDNAPCLSSRTGGLQVAGSGDATAVMPTAVAVAVGAVGSSGSNSTVMPSAAAMVAGALAHPDSVEWLAHLHAVVAEVLGSCKDKAVPPLSSMWLTRTGCDDVSLRFTYDGDVCVAVPLKRGFVTAHGFVPRMAAAGFVLKKTECHSNDVVTFIFSA